MQLLNGGGCVESDFKHVSLNCQTFFCFSASNQPPLFVQTRMLMFVWYFMHILQHLFVSVSQSPTQMRMVAQTVLSSFLSGTMRHAIQILYLRQFVFTYWGSSCAFTVALISMPRISAALLSQTILLRRNAHNMTLS